MQSTERPPWLKAAKAKALSALAKDASSLVAESATKARAELAAVEADESISDFARDVELDVRMESARTELVAAVGERASVSRGELSSEIEGADIAIDAGAGATTLSGFDAGAKKIASAAVSDFDTGVGGDEASPALDAAKAQMAEARTAALAAWAAAKEAIAARKKKANAAVASDAPVDVRLRERERLEPAPRRSLRALGLAAAGCVGLAGASVAIALALGGEKEAAATPTPAPRAVIESAEPSDANRPLGAGSPERLEKWKASQKSAVQAPVHEMEARRVFGDRAPLGDRGRDR